ncbi:DUF547 domain-containing protein [Bermanella sp. R86510]|uniref:DUF547 domain-containing protein n=1 Tax=unclassified Bermanella TaxID=2627862 RepID=UPI0037CB55E0
MKRITLFLAGIFLVSSSYGFDHSSWTELLQEHVIVEQGGAVTWVDYAAIQQNHNKLERYLASLSNVNREQFNSWTPDKQLAFLINAYNAFTVKLILTEYTDIESIKDLGSWFSSPWKKEFISLLGDMVSLDQIEHGMIREEDVYNDPRIHFAVNCASIGCPALRNEAYIGKDLDSQLNQQTRLFLSDQSRNYLDQGALYLSSIFKWYKEDFEKGWKGYTSLEMFLLDYADALALSDSEQSSLQKNNIDIEFLDYDWKLNDSKNR